MTEFRKGIYQPINNEKYVGKRPIVFRSSWEAKFCRFLDTNPAVVEWSSESIAIGYINPVTGNPTRYYPDFLFKYKDTSGNMIIELVEIKPYKQTIPPIVGKNKRKSTLLNESKTWAVNTAKWQAAIAYCKLRGIKFRIMTERDLGV